MHPFYSTTSVDTIIWNQNLCNLLIWILVNVPNNTFASVKPFMKVEFIYFVFYLCFRSCMLIKTTWITPISVQWIMHYVRICNAMMSCTVRWANFAIKHETFPRLTCKNPTIKPTISPTPSTSSECQVKQYRIKVDTPSFSQGKFG